MYKTITEEHEICSGVWLKNRKTGDEYLVGNFTPGSGWELIPCGENLPKGISFYGDPKYLRQTFDIDIKA